MSMPRIPRFLSLVVVVAAMVTLVGATVLTTGAYFTDSHPGQYTGTFGNVSVSVDGHGTGTDNLQLDWPNMLPSIWNNSTISVTNTGTATESIWLVFDNANLEWSSLNTLGSYGEWYVSGHYYTNLNNVYAQGTPSAFINACGDAAGPISYLPHVNSLGNLASGGSANYQVSFRYTACFSNNAAQGQPAFANPLKFAIVATQNGILPNDPHNGAGTIPNLILPVVGPCFNPPSNTCTGTFQ